MIEVPFGDWMPDAPDYNNPGLVEAENCYPTAGGYDPFQGPVKQAQTTTEPVTGAAMFFDQSSNAVVFGGSSTRLFTLRAGTVTETAGYTATVNGWEFERFNDLVIATSLENDPQYLTDIDSDDTWSTLPGSPPKAAQVGKVDDFLVFGNLIDVASVGGPTVPNRVRWSAKNDPTQAWVTDRGELSDFRDLDPKYGSVTAIVGGRFGLVFQERAVWRMVFIGSPQVFEFEPVAVDRGCIASGSAVTIGTDTFFLSQDGFYVTNGAAVQPIGAGKVNEWFKGQVSETDIRKTHGSVNWGERSIVWAFYPDGETGFNRQLIYNFVLDRWSSASEMLHYLVQSRENGETLGTLGAAFPGGLGTMSAFTLGSSEWQAKDLSFAAFVAEGVGSDYAPLDGPPKEAQFVTGDTMVQPGRRSTITGVWPVVQTQSSAITTRIRTRNQQGGGVSTTNPTTKAADGYCPHHVDGWLHSVRTTIPANESWEKASGVQVRFKRTGRR